MANDRTHQFKMRLSDEEMATVRALADRQGLNVADYFRQLIRREMHAAIAYRQPTPEMFMPPPLSIADLPKAPGPAPIPQAPSRPPARKSKKK